MLVQLPSSRQTRGTSAACGRRQNCVNKQELLGMFRTAIFRGYLSSAVVHPFLSDTWSPLDTWTRLSPLRIPRRALFGPARNRRREHKGGLLGEFVHGTL